MRWVGSLVVETHRILMRGGVFLYPRDSRDKTRNGRLRLLYEASPIAMLIEQASGRASTGRERILDLLPTSLHQRVPLIFGASEEVERIERYCRDPDEAYDAPLFGVRGLFRTVN
jgi:fructose-1,6-bisphosphatase I / sedoheptulose-1,7-bisphosphatase